MSIRSLAFFLLIAMFLLACNNPSVGHVAEEQLPEVAVVNEAIWILDCPTENIDSCAYKDQAGQIRIPYGKYQYMTSDTFDRFVIVWKNPIGFVAINKQEEILFKVVNYDNGPDYVSEGYIRIEGPHGKIGYADYEKGTVAIRPQFIGAGPFENGYAPVCPNCSTEQLGEYTVLNGKWGLIDKNGKMVLESQYHRIYEIKDGKVLISLAADDERKWIKIPL